ncbi:MAG: hypothetical protein HKN62_16045 [Phycisphaerales bacterium]|nr:hypothetical protein [Phycisphaerales bacterium]
MSKTNSQSENSILAVVHRTGGKLRVVIANGATGTATGTPELLTAVEFPDADGEALNAELQRHGVSRVIGVIPASSVICRTCTLPSAQPEQLEQALRLQAEAHLLGHAPEHRTAMAVLPEAPGETSRSGIILSWPESAPAPPTGLAAERTFTPDIAGLAALLNGQRPTDPIIFLDRSSSALALIVPHANGALLRATREEPTSDGAWRQQVGRVLAETALNGGHSPGYANALQQKFGDAIGRVEPNAAALLLPPEIIDAARTRVSGTPAEPAWWSDYGVAVGVLLAATGPLARLTGMLDTPFQEKPSRLDRLTASLSQPRTAFRTAVVCLLLFAVAPVAIAGLRVTVLKLRHPDLGQHVAALNDRKVEFAMYHALEQESWSATKLLADIVTNTPMGIDLEAMRLQRSDMSFSISGQARPHDGKSATEIVSALERSLLDSRLFNSIQLNWGDRNAYQHYQFDLSAKIERPFYRSPYDVENDFGKWSYADRRDNIPPGAEPDAAMAVEDDPAADVTGSADPAPPDAAIATAETTPPDGDPTGESDTGATRRPGGFDRPRVGTGSSSGGPGSRSSLTDRDQTGTAAIGIPEQLSEAQIDSMSIEDVRKHLVEVSKASARARKMGDTELQDRLKVERDLLLKRLRGGL